MRMYIDGLLSQRFTRFKIDTESMIKEIQIG